VLRLKFDKETKGHWNKKSQEMLYRKWDETLVGGMASVEGLSTEGSEQFNFMPNNTTRSFAKQSFSLLPTSLPKLSRADRLNDTTLNWISTHLHKKKVSTKPTPLPEQLFERLFTENSLKANLTFEQRQPIKPFNPSMVSAVQVETPGSSKVIEEPVNNSLPSIKSEPRRLSIGKAVKAHTKSYSNSYGLCPIASSRNFSFTLRRGEDAHPFAKKLPPDLRILNRTASDFYVLQRKNKGLQSAERSVVYPSSRSIKVTLPFELEYMEEEYMISIHRTPLHEHCSPEEGQDDQNQQQEDSIVPPSPDLAPTAKRSPHRYHPRYEKVSPSFSNLILRDKQDDMSPRKLVSIFPYKSYWLKCINHCLERDDLFDGKWDPGYYITLSIKEGAGWDGDPTDLDDLPSPRDTIEAEREALLEMEAKFRQDLQQHEQRLQNLIAKKMYKR